MPLVNPLPLSVRLFLGCVLLLCVVLTAYRYGRDPEYSVIEFQGNSMGTTWSVKIATGALPKSEQEKISKTLKYALSKVDSLMSTWREDSELSKFNRYNGVIPFALSSETFAVFEVAQSVARSSKGALDITVAPLVEEWGFGPGGTQEFSGHSNIKGFQSRIGFEKLELFPNGPAVSKSIPGVKCDLSAIAKGFAVDEVARGLRDLGFENFLVEIGGELKASGTHLNGQIWRVAIEAPIFEEDGFTRRKVHRVLDLNNLAMATSGDYRNYVEREGERYSHTIDPMTGRPVKHSLASVTVIHEMAVWADAWATALNVLGPDAGYNLARKEKLSAYFISRQPISGSETDNGIEVRFTPEFAVQFQGHRN